MAKDTIIGWFSCGATSAVACKLGLQMYDNVRLIYIDTGTAHPDNERFLSECEKWYGQTIERVKSKKYKNVADVLLRRRYINGAGGAACSLLLKKQVRYEIEDELGTWGGKFGASTSVKEKLIAQFASNSKTPTTSHCTH